MNIFFLDPDPILAARQMCDKHVVKMIVESAQLLSTAHRVLDGTMYLERTANGRSIKRWRLDNNYLNSELYKASHVNHPSAIWCRESVANYNWLYDHFIALCDEYTQRYGKTHLTYTKLADALRGAPNNIDKVRAFTQPPPAMKSNPDCIVPGDSVASYRNYYNVAKRGFAKWAYSQAPDWFTNYKVA